MPSFPPLLRRRALAVAATLAAVAAVAPAPAQAQVFNANSAPAGPVQGLNLAGGGTYFEGQWIPYSRFRLNAQADLGALGVPGGVQSAGFEFRGKAQPSFGLEGRFLVPGAPWLFGTLEYRYEQFDEARLYAGRQRSGFGDIDDINLQTFRVGAGVRIPETPFYARGEYVNTRLEQGDLGDSFDDDDDDNDFGSARDDGYAVFGGFAQPVTQTLGVRAEAGYQDLNDLGDGFAWQAGLNLNLTRILALTGNYRVVRLRGDEGSSSRFEQASVGLRVQFDR